MQRQSDERLWAERAFGHAELGDSRRTDRLVEIATRAAQRPCGKLSAVFKVARELDAAYDFVERDHTCIRRLGEAVGRATAEECRGLGRVRIAVDGSSLTLTDQDHAKGFGAIGTTTAGTRGLKVVSALVVDEDGATVGLLSQSWWARPKSPPRRSRQERKRANDKKKAHRKESRYWLGAIGEATSRLDEFGAKGWFQLDREADAWSMLTRLAASGHWFTVRSASSRVIADDGTGHVLLRPRMGASRIVDTYFLEVPAAHGRRARRARMVVRAAFVTLQMRDATRGKRHPLCVNVVWTREEGTTPRSEKPIDWMLLTNAPVDTKQAVRLVVEGYAMRWRVEEFHKTWRTGGCNAQLTQLRSRNAVIRWATILAVVATRIERLKRIARTEPDAPASTELSPIEIEVLVVMKRRYKKKTENVPDGIPSIAQAVRWIADLGGYTGESSGGPPGSITIQRGLEHLSVAVEAVLAMRDAKQ